MRNLPPGGQSEKMAKRVGNIVGEFSQISADEFGYNWGNVLRFRVKLQASQPLPRGLLITVDFQPSPIWVTFSFERLPDFCYLCGRVDHIDADYPEKRELQGKPKLFGSWMRTPLFVSRFDENSSSRGLGRRSYGGRGQTRETNRGRGRGRADRSGCRWRSESSNQDGGSIISRDFSASSSRLSGGEGSGNLPKNMAYQNQALSSAPTDDEASGHRRSEAQGREIFKSHSETFADSPLIDINVGSDHRDSFLITLCFRLILRGREKLFPILIVRKKVGPKQ